mmetsp:Transcript_74425/g.192031  ORF Transcript_74425/g.192031 Transcript_74425/m.192031 type:complete len:576 (-) Transcript_74425:49-1776(-)
MVSTLRLRGSAARRGVAIAAACVCVTVMAGRSFVATPATALRGAEEQMLHRSPSSLAPEAPVAGSSTTAVSGVLAGLAAVSVTAATARRVSRRQQRRKSEAPRPQIVIPQMQRDPAITALKAMITTAAPEVDLSMTGQNTAIVDKKSVLVLGATGTLGRQVVRQFLNAGYNVRCMIRNRADRPFSFLVDWGASVVEGTLIRPESIPSALIGVHTVVDCSCARPEENIFNVDWEGKKNLIQCCEKMEIQRYIFMSIKDCDKFESVPLMNIKSKTEQFLKKSGLRYTVLRTSGFMQPLISQYAVSVLDNQQVFGDDGSSPGIAYIDSQDCARMLVACAAKERSVGQTITLTGPKVWSASQVIQLCEKLSGRKADVSTVPNIILQLTQAAASLFMWSTDIAERLRFVEVNQQKAMGTASTMSEEAYQQLGMNSEYTRDLDDYIGEYYRRVFKKLTKGKYEPEAGELEREKADMDKKLEEVTKEDPDDKPPAGQPPADDISILSQRDMSDRLQKLFEDKQLEKMESPDEAWFGLTTVAELVNGRSAMMGFSLGLFTEWATDVSVAKQMDLILAVFSPPA